MKKILNRINYESEWLSVYRTSSFRISYDVAGYFDDRPSITINAALVGIILRLPFHNKKWRDECDPPGYGVSVHNSIFWIHTGGKGNIGGNTHITWRIPFFYKNHYAKWMLRKDGTWQRGIGRSDLKDGDWQHYYREEFDFTDWHDGTELTAAVSVNKSEWRPKWLGWTGMFAKVSRFLDIEFSRELGSEKGSWKGGILEMCCKMNDGESPEECLRRIESEGSFGRP